MAMAKLKIPKKNNKAPTFINVKASNPKGGYGNLVISTGLAEKISSNIPIEVKYIDCLTFVISSLYLGLLSLEMAIFLAIIQKVNPKKIPPMGKAIIDIMV